MRSKQRKAVSAHGNTIVAAGATVVRKCAHLIHSEWFTNNAVQSRWLDWRACNCALECSAQHLLVEQALSKRVHDFGQQRERRCVLFLRLGNVCD